MAEEPITKVFIGRLPQDCTHGDIEQILAFANIDEEAIKKCEIQLVHDRATDSFKGFAYVELHSEEYVDKVLTLNKAEFAGQQLRVDKATPKADDRRGGRGGPRGGGGGRGGFRGGPRGGGHEGFRGGSRGGGGGEGRRGSDSGPSPGQEPACWERGQEAGGRGGRGGFDGGRGGHEMRRGGFDGPRGGRGGPGHEGARGGGGYRGGFRDRRDSHRGGRGGRGGFNNNERRGSASSEKREGDIVVDDSADHTERPRLQLTKLNLDPEALEAKKQREEEEEKARRAKLFQV